MVFIIPIPRNARNATQRNATQRNATQYNAPLRCRGVDAQVEHNHTTSHHITSHHITSHHITSHHTTPHHTTSPHLTSHSTSLASSTMSLFFHLSPPMSIFTSSLNPSPSSLLPPPLNQSRMEWTPAISAKAKLLWDFLCLHHPLHGQYDCAIAMGSYPLYLLPSLTSSLFIPPVLFSPLLSPVFPSPPLSSLP